MGYKVNNLCNTEGCPFYLLKPLMDYVNIPYFIETGTAGGVSIKEASKYFKKCWTIELVEGRAQKDLSLQNVEWLTGHTIDMLLPLVNELVRERNGLQAEGQPSVYKYAIFFLDAHWSEPYPNNTKYKECYILEELEIISDYQDSAIIVIDDVRLFLGHPPAPLNPKEWASIQQIFSLFNEKYPYNYTTIVDDYILSIPERLREPIDAEWRKNYIIRYPSHQDSIKMQAKNVFNEFKKYIE